jgi:hypothetical protein
MSELSCRREGVPPRCRGGRGEGGGECGGGHEEHRRREQRLAVGRAPHGQYAFTSVPTMRALASDSSRTARSVASMRVWSLREMSSASEAR